MERNVDLIRVLVKGGVLSPNEMKQVVSLCKLMGLDYFHFGSRQDILLPKLKEVSNLEDSIPDLDLSLISDKKYQNIVSSYVSANILDGTPWVKGATYLYILGDFKFKPRLKINIVDPRQKLVPLVTGDLNFIASKHTDYWYLYIRFGKLGLMRFPVLIYTWDIAQISLAIEEVIGDMDSIDDLYQEVIFNIEARSRTITEDLEIPFQSFPNYEGLNQESQDSMWLGLYWRDNRYDIHFMEALAEFCLIWKVGRICVTPWKSFIIKSIPKEAIIPLEKLLGRFGINTRHSSLELNWHLPVIVPEALELKKFIVRSFDQNDISTHGLTFGISTSASIPFTSILLKENEMPPILGAMETQPTFDVFYADNFDSNKEKYHIYAQDVDKQELPNLLMELSKMYFEQLNELTSSIQLNKEIPVETQLIDEPVYQCLTCGTVYDEKVGDPLQGIAPTEFSLLSDTYSCYTCGEGKSNFVKKKGSEVFFTDFG